jgi:DNA recombination protein RmuC
MVVNMPDRRRLVVDVKTPLDAYLEAAEARNDPERKIGLERHARNLRTHIRLLASKNYWNQFDESPEFVILFIPGDQFLSAALNEQPDLIEFALSKQIILATPTSFVALLKAVAYGWRQLALAENAKEIRTLAEDLYARLGTYVGHMNRMGRQLASSVETYNKAVGSLERSVLPGARKFVELGIHEKKVIERLESLEPVPRAMIDPSDDSVTPDDDLPADKTLQ